MLMSLLILDLAVFSIPWSVVNSRLMRSMLAMLVSFSFVPSGLVVLLLFLGVLWMFLGVPLSLLGVNLFILSNL